MTDLNRRPLAPEASALPLRQSPKVVKLYQMSGTLYIVATPIGNLKDITLRAIETLHKVDLILAEDTRVSKRLLDRYNINTKLVSYHQHSTDEKKAKILKSLLDGSNIALVTDSGTPGVSDPGNELIGYLLEREDRISITSIPGASALTSAISVSGLKMSKFLFLGFLQKKKKNKLFEWIKMQKYPICFYESPKRILKTLDFIEDQLGKDVLVFIARELTKMNESIYRGTVQSVKKDLVKDKLKGEMVVIVSFN